MWPKSVLAVSELPPSSTNQQLLLHERLKREMETKSCCFLYVVNLKKKLIMHTQVIETSFWYPKS